MQFDNLFNGDKALGEGTNRFLNEAWQEILNELKPVLKKAIGNIAKGVVTPIISKFPYNDLFLWMAPFQTIIEIKYGHSKIYCVFILYYAPQLACLITQR